MIAKVLNTLAPRAIEPVRLAFAEDVEGVFEEGGLTTPLRQAHFLAQVLAETGGGRSIEEGLDYTAARIVAVWPSRFADAAAARPYAHNPVALANAVYGGRMGNSHQPDDGWRFRGRGLLQMTGRAMYRLIGDAIGAPLEADPAAALDPKNLLPAALAVWSLKKCNLGADADNVRSVTRRINGGLIGLKERAEWLCEAKRAMGI